MSDLIKRLREVWPRSAICNEAADALENPMHAALMVAAERCEIERAGYELHPKADTSRTGENAYIVGYQDGCADCRDGIEKLASEYPPAVCVPVKILKQALKYAKQLPLEWGSKAARENDAFIADVEAMITAARKP